VELPLQHRKFPGFHIFGLPSPDTVTPNRGGPEIESHVCLAGTRKKYELASWFSLKFKLINYHELTLLDKRDYTPGPAGE